MFHMVLIFNCKYKTNKYRLPLLEIIGITLTKLTLFVGFAYLEHERQEKFSHKHWRNWRSCLNMKRYFPMSWWVNINFSWWIPLKLFSHPHSISYVFSILQKLLVQSARSLFTRIDKSMWLNYGTRSCIQIGCSSMSNLFS